MTGWPDVGELEELATWAARVHWSRLLQFDERWLAAWDGLTEAAATGDPDLKMAALTGISRAVDKRKQHHGLPGAGARGTGERFAVYWRGAPCAEGFAEAVEDKIALGQVLTRLTPSHRNALSALADADGDIGRAADILGVSYSAANSIIWLARRDFRRLWFAPEAPARYYSRNFTRRKSDWVHAWRWATSGRRRNRKESSRAA